MNSFEMNFNVAFRQNYVANYGIDNHLCHEFRFCSAFSSSFPGKRGTKWIKLLVFRFLAKVKFSYFLYKCGKN